MHGNLRLRMGHTVVIEGFTDSSKLGGKLEDVDKDRISLGVDGWDPGWPATENGGKHCRCRMHRSKETLLE